MNNHTSKSSRIYKIFICVALLTILGVSAANAHVSDSCECHGPRYYHSDKYEDVYHDPYYHNGYCRGYYHNYYYGPADYTPSYWIAGHWIHTRYHGNIWVPGHWAH